MAVANIILPGMYIIWRENICVVDSINADGIYAREVDTDAGIFISPDDFENVSIY